MSSNRKFLIMFLVILISFMTTSYGTTETNNPDINIQNIVSIEKIENQSKPNSFIESKITELVKTVNISETVKNSTDLFVDINNSVKNLSNSRINTEINTIGPYELDVESKFREVQNLAYNEKTMNCTVKSKIFADYLLNNGGQSINLVIIEHASGEYSHEFVEWNGHYYDPCNSGESYTLTEEEYIQKLRNLGFSGMIIKSPYKG
jgi:hypothetical protein